MVVKKFNNIYHHNDKVSIIMPSYNSSLFISKSIDSILAQTYHNWELLITDDGSIDNTFDIVNEYVHKDNRIKLYLLKNNFGAAITRNNSLKHARGRYIAFCDSDDVWKPNKLQLQIDFLIKNNIAFTCCSYNHVYNHKIIGTINPPKILTYSKLLQYCTIGTSTVIYDTEFIPKLDFPIIKRRQDYALWLIIFQSIKKSLSTSENLVDYNIRYNSLSSNKFKSAFYHFYVLLKFSDLNLLLIIYNFIIYTFRGFYIHTIKPIGKNL